MKQLLFTPLAEQDLNQILDFIAETRPLTATQVISRIRENCELLRSQPDIGRSRPDFPGDYRTWPVQRWLIFYRVTERTVEIHRVLDGARDIETLLR